ncbi:MAG: hypothetical protein ACOVOR_05320 [Rhabdochlamydiaceae bacterium]
MDVVEIKESKTDTRNTLDSLIAAGMNMPSIDDRILHKTINYLSEVFFTKKKEFSNEE